MRLTKKEIKYLSASFQNATLLSLFKNIEETPDGSEYQSLVDKGVIKGNSYDPEALEILMTLSSADRSSRFIVQNPFFIVEKYTYKFQDKLVLAENYEGELEFSIVNDITEISSKLAEIYGVSKIVTTEISEVFTPDEMVVLYSVIDLVRIAQLKNYAGENTADMKFTSDEITKQLGSDYKNGFAQIFISNYNYPVPESSKVSEVLDMLSQRGAVRKEENAYSLEGEFLSFANNYLIIESISMYESFEIQSDGEIAAAAKLAVSCGIHNLAAMYFDGDLVEFDTISAKQLLFNIDDFMGCPTFEKKDQKPATEAVETKTQTSLPQQPANEGDGSWTCHNCGKQNTGKFCGGCGTPKP